MLGRDGAAIAPSAITHWHFLGCLLHFISSSAEPWANRDDRGGRRECPALFALLTYAAPFHLQLLSLCQEAFHDPLLLSHSILCTPLWHLTLKGSSQFPGFHIGAKVSFHLKISFHFHFSCKGPHKIILKTSSLSATQRRGKLIFMAQNLEKIKSILLIMANVVVGHESGLNH